MSWNPSLLAQAIAFLLIFVLVRPAIRTGYHFYSLRKIPRAKTRTSNGWLADLMKEPKAPEVLEYIARTPNDGLLRYSGMFGAPRVLITDSQGLREVLYEKSYSFHKSNIAKRIIGPLLGGGLLVAEGDLHKIQKKRLGPAFAPRHIKDLFPTIWNKTIDLIAALSQDQSTGSSGSSSVVNFSVWAARATLDIISVAAFGGDFDTIDHPESELSQAYGILFAPRQRRDLRSTLAIFLPLGILQALPLQRNHLIKTSNRTIRAFCQKSIREAKAQAAKPDPPSGTNILSVALKSESFEDPDLVDQLMTFLVAGHETTAQSLSWAVFNLCKHPHMQTRLRVEIRAHLPSPSSMGGAATAQAGHQVEDLPFLQAVCNETLRLMPVIPMVYRQAAEPTSVLGRYVPKGTVIAMSPWAANRSTEEWGEDAGEFHPERWMELDDGGSKHTPKKTSGLLTFLHGPRSCVGQGFARAELAVLLAGIVGSFELELAERAEGTREEFGFITVKPAGGLRVRTRRLDGW